MIGEAQATVRNVGLLIVQRGFEVAGTFIFAALVPRLMGPDIYGRYALVTSLSIWFVLFSDLGITQVIVRYVPQFILQEEKKDLQKFFSYLLTVSLVWGTLCAGFYLLLTSLWLRDLDRLLLAIIAGTVIVRGWSQPFFALLLGLSQAARWGMAQMMRRWVSLVFLLPGFYLGGLRGACLGLLLTELVVLAVGIGWGRSFLSWPNFHLNLNYLSPYLRFGLIFFFTSLIFTSFNRSGEVLIRFFHGNYVQVGYFGVSYNVYLTVATAIPQFTLAFTPLLTTLLANGDTEAIRQWTEQLLKWLAVGGMLVVFAVLLLGEDLVPIVLGKAYRPVASNLLPLSLALLTHTLGSVATLLTLIYERPKMAFVAGTIRLSTFWALGLPLVARWGSLGGCVAVLAASTLYAFYFNWRIQKVISYSLRKWTFAIGLGSFFLPLWWLRSSCMANLAFYGIFVVGYFFLLFFLKLITREEITALRRVISQKGLRFEPSFQESQ